MILQCHKVVEFNADKTVNIDFSRKNIVHSNVNLGKHGPSNAQDKPHHWLNFKMLMYEIFNNNKKFINNFLCAVTIYSNLESKTSKFEMLI